VKGPGIFGALIFLLAQHLPLCHCLQLFVEWASGSFLRQVVLTQRLALITTFSINMEASINKVCLLALFLAIVAGGCGGSDMTKDSLTQIIRSGSRPIQAEAQSDNYVIRQGDQIQLSVWGYPEFDSRTTVKELGQITLPLLGEVTAAGLTKEQFTQQMIKKLSEYIQGEIKLTITVVSSAPQKVTVLGEVTRQENYTLTTDATLIEVLSTAGGTTPDSDLRNIKILRGGGQNRQPIEVDLTWYMEHGNIESIPVIRPGDTVFVPKRANIIRELSDFMRDAIFIFGFFQVFNN
jgi:polysaccharide export outer membrane protein